MDLNWGRLGLLKGKLAMAMPLGKQGPHPTTFFHWSRTIKLLEQRLGPIGLCHAWAMPVHTCRQFLADLMLESHYDWLLCIDSDMVWDDTLIYRLLLDLVERPYIRFLSGTARMSGMENGKHASVIYQHRQDGWERQEVWPIDLFKVDRIGLFGHIIHCSVFESIQSPWYEGWDECYAFCDKVRAAGFDIWADGRAPFGHIGQYVVDGLPEE